MVAMTKSSRTNLAYKDLAFISTSNLFTNENGVSARSWSPMSEENENSTNNDVSVTLFSTGLCKLNYSVSANNTSYTWGIRILDENKEELLTFEFAPMIIESLNREKRRPFKLERRFIEIDSSFIENAAYIQVQNME